MNLDQAYDRCEAITAAEARNFAWGIKLLPAPKRRAMSALYAVARRIDDVGDAPGPERPGAGGAQSGIAVPERPGAGGAQSGVAGPERPGAGGALSGIAVPAPVKLEALAELRKQLDAIAHDPGAAGEDPVLIALADAARRYPIPMGALAELIEGCEMDVQGTTYATFDDLVGYCRRVAGTVGRLSLSVYGCDDPAVAEPLADALGVALQITNILRDVVEDRDEMGRVYLPAADRARFGVADDLSGPTDAVVALIAFETGRAEEWYGRGLALLPMLDRRSRACTAAMAGIYHRLLDRIRRDPAAVLRGRLSLPAREKATVAARSLVKGTV